MFAFHLDTTTSLDGWLPKTLTACVLYVQAADGRFTTAILATTVASPAPSTFPL